MNARRHPIVPLFAILVLLVCASAAEAPMTDEDVVRMLVSGVDVDVVLRDIAQREPAFDLTDEMVDEMRRAGVPDTVLRAMRTRQQRHDATTADAGAPADSERGDEGLVRLRVLLDPRRGDSPRFLKIARDVDPQLAAEWELGNSPEEQVFADVAVFLACRTADHVPHQWRAQSPLGQDFISMPRHRMLALVGEGSSEGGRTLRFELPPWLEGSVAAGDTHDIMVGIALHVGGRYHRLADARRDGWLPERDGNELAVRIRGRGLTGYALAFEN